MYVNNILEFMKEHLYHFDTITLNRFESPEKLLNLTSLGSIIHKKNTNTIAIVNVVRNLSIVQSGCIVNNPLHIGRI